MKNYLIILFCLVSVLTSANDVNILHFGAVPDGKTLTTKAIQDAIDRCNATGGGTVTVPSGTYLTNTIFLKSNVNLCIERGATILGSTDPTAFKEAVVFADSIENAAITGFGVINGQGSKQFYPKSGPRHHNIMLYKSKNITVKDVTLINSSNWVFRIRESEWVMVQGIRIYSFTNENNDGIDIDGKNITITDCIIDCDDDALCFKSHNPDYLVENVTISNCIVASNCNALKFGTKGFCGFKNISISNCVIRRPSEAVHRRWAELVKGVSNDTTVISGIALEIVDGGLMDQVTISNITMTGIQTPIFIKLGNRNGIGTLKNVVISNITASNESLMCSSITGIPGTYVENVIIKDVIFNCKGTGTKIEAEKPVPEVEGEYPENRMFGYSMPAYGLYTRHVKNLMFENFRFNLLEPDARPAIVLDDCHNIRISNFSADQPTDNKHLVRVIQSSNVTISGYHATESIAKFLKVEGANTANIKLTGNDFSQVKEVVNVSKECKAGVVKEMGNFRKP